ncbi:PSP1-domain-containing protein [Pleomassaria siparia CBS 279.74]|uniref:PSP1-domain-containing protein n=1 Tax=Pleomassaria siparia CBS 279.74 TaxID=1314801 RepID=A0A6G1K150_9PLEO|nr:PSP1-domain-containing protein [Pleomassaria siparia CBS 279.74]
MSSSNYKGGLTASTLFDKNKLQMRRPTPDSDVLASSDDDSRPAPTPFVRRPSMGWLGDIKPRKPSLPGPSALPSPLPAQPDDAIGFLLNQQSPIRKAVRSQSYSIGQQDIENSPIGQFSARSQAPVRARLSKPSLLSTSALGLSQLREDDIDEVESSNGSEQGIRLPTGYWEREQKQALLKQAAQQNALARHRPTSRMSRPDSDYAIDELDDGEAALAGRSSLTRRFSEHIAAAREAEVDRLADNMKMPNWGIGNPPQPESLGRRHSFATVGSHTSHQTAFHISTLSNTYEMDEGLISPSTGHAPPEQFDAAAYFAGYGPASRAINASAISAAHPDPHTSTTNPYSVPTVLRRPGRRLFIVTFKCSRADIYYLFDNTGLEVRCGDLVIVEGDRGCDLGQVAYADITMEEAKTLKKEANEEHLRWLVMFSQYSLAGASSDAGMLGALAKANGFPNTTRSTLTTMGASVIETETKPKMIKRVAQKHEVDALREKEGAEAKAKRVAAQKAAEHRLPMEILDAEYQLDYHKLIFYYFAKEYVNFNELVTELFKLYKVRIWMSAVNPDSVINPAGLMQQPSAIGPGALNRPRAQNTTLPVGPGFGSSSSYGSYRTNPQYGAPPTPSGVVQNLANTSQGHQARAGNTAAGYGSYEDAYHPFANQLPSFAAPTYSQQWSQAQQYGGRYGSYPTAGGYPNASGSGSPMNYGNYYPPTTFSSSPAFKSATSGAAYDGASGTSAAVVPYTTGAGAALSNTATTGGSTNYNSAAYATGAGSVSSNTATTGYYNSAAHTSGSGNTVGTPTAGPAYNLFGPGGNFQGAGDRAVSGSSGNGYSAGARDAVASAFQKISLNK